MSHKDALIAAGMNEKAAEVFADLIDRRGGVPGETGFEVLKLATAGVPPGLGWLMADDLTDAVFLKRQARPAEYVHGLGVAEPLAAAIANAINSVVEGSRPELVT